MESLAEDLRTMVRRPLAESHVAALGAAGSHRDIAAGELLADAGDGIDTFHLVETGEIEIVGRDGAATPGPG